MISLVVFGLIYALVLNLAEAKIDSLERKDGEPYDYYKKEEPFISFLLYFCFIISLFIHSFEISVLKLTFLWFGVRVFFDIMYNYFRDFHWSYLGTTATTDKFLKRFNPYILLGIRLAILVLTIFYSL